MAREDVTRDFGEQDQATIDAAQRDIAALLAVEPSPEFRARVRTRIGAEPQPARWWRWSWALATVTAVMIVAAGAAVLIRTGNARRQASAVSAGPTTPNAGSEIRPKTDSTHAVNREAESAGSQPEGSAPIGVRHIPPATHAVHNAVETEVVVDRAQADAVRRLLAIASRAPRDTTVELPPEAIASEVTSIPLAPMVVEPLAVPELKPDNKGVER